MTTEDMHKIVDYSGNRPVGEPAKEIGAAMVTLASLCVIAGFDLMACAEADLEKLQRPETIDRIRAKRATRHGRGPLPGFDPALTLKDDPGNGGDGEDNQPRYTTKRLRDEIAKAKAYARREALEEAAKAAETAQISGSLVRPGAAKAIRALIPEREG
jgi:hypothetical protein